MLGTHRSLLMFQDQMNGDAHSVGLDWKSFKLTWLLKDSFLTENRLAVVVHTPPHKSVMSSTLWSLAFGSATTKLMSAEVTLSNR